MQQTTPEKKKPAEIDLFSPDSGLTLDTANSLNSSEEKTDRKLEMIRIQNFLSHDDTMQVE
jgi:hypothetical protein